MQYIKRKILITVMTYPMPSATHKELVCTAGVLEDGSFIRLYPVSFRYQPYWQWYKKYQWIEVEVKKNEKDPRKESWRPKLDTIRTLGKPIPTDKNWAQRKKYVLAQGVRSIKELEEARKADNTSLGIVKPSEVSDFLIEPSEADWKPQWRSVLAQNWLFGPGQKPLEKIPFKFSYKFKCGHSRCTGHTMMIEDWEVGRLWLRMRDKHGDPLKAAEDVRNKFLHEICSPDRDPHFFVGTVLPYNTWIILGVFWPKKA
jgi:hypothetical protein